MSMFSSPVFRELVVFTPEHRQAFCLEPYTCTTDAVNLQSRGLDTGWLELAQRLEQVLRTFVEATYRPGALVYPPLPEVVSVAPEERP